MHDSEHQPAVDRAVVHEPPSIIRLGTLADLTMGGVVGPDDGLGGAGDASELG